jgi:hypothetical protein
MKRNPSLMFLIPLKIKDELGYTRTLKTKEEQLAFHIKNEIITNTTDGAAREIATKITNGHFTKLLKYQETPISEPAPDPNWQQQLGQLSRR